MPELDFALLANAGQVSSDHLISILGGGWDTGTLPEGSFPAGIVLTVAFRLLFDEQEAGRTHAGEIVVEQEDGSRLAAVTFTVQVEWAEGIPSGWKSNVPFALPVPVQFPSVTEEDVEQALRQRIRMTPGEPGSMWVHGYTRGGHVLKVCVAVDDHEFVITVAWPEDRHWR